MISLFMSNLFVMWLGFLYGYSQAIATALMDKAFNGVDGKIVQGLLKMSEKHRS